MQAVVFHDRRDVRVEDVPAPGQPGPGDVLLDVEYASICGTDAAEYLHGPIFVPLEIRHPGSGHVGPTVLGHEFVGRVAAAGEGVDAEPGQLLVCGAGVSCGTCDWCRAGRTNLCASYYTLGLHTNGGLAEQVIAPAAICVPTPAGADPVAAALSQPLSVALHAVTRGGVGDGGTVAVIGVGGIGAFIVAAAASRGTEQLVAVDVDDGRLETARRLGATVTLLAGDETAEQLQEATRGGVDVVLEASGTAQGLTTAFGSVRRGGRVVLVGLHEQLRPLDLLSLNLREIDIVTTIAHVCATDLPEAVRILAGPGVAEHVIDRVVPLESFLEDGLLPLAEGKARGKIVVDVACTRAPRG